MRIFWNDTVGEHSLHRSGVRIPCTNGSYLFTARFACVLADELAIKDIFSCKGSSGRRPCISCGVVGRCDASTLGPGLTHYSDPDLSTCQTFNSEMYIVMANKLSEAAADARRLDELEVILGLKFNPNTVLSDRTLRVHAPMPAAVFWDWQHNFCSSGGIAQIEINAYVLCICAIGNPKISLEQLDDFCSKIVLGNGMTKLTSTFFRDRVGE